MTEDRKDDGGPAFPPSIGISPSDDIYMEHGMSMRDWFAGMALQGYLSGSPAASGFMGDDDTAVQMYRMADAMLKASQS